MLTIYNCTHYFSVSRRIEGSNPPRPLFRDAPARHSGEPLLRPFPFLPLSFLPTPCRLGVPLGKAWVVWAAEGLLCRPAIVAAARDVDNR